MLTSVGCLGEHWCSPGRVPRGPQPHYLSRIHSSHPSKMAGKSIPYKVKLMPLHFVIVWKREAGVGHYRLLGGISLVTWYKQKPPHHVHAQWES